jgi:hypothetical protein
MLDHTPVLWEYWPLRMVAREGQQSALETKAFEKLMPLALSTERVFGMYLRSSFRMSSVRMKTMLGLAVSTPNLVINPATHRRIWHGGKSGL